MARLTIGDVGWLVEQILADAVEALRLARDYPSMRVQHRWESVGLYRAAMRLAAATDAQVWNEWLTWDAWAEAIERAASAKEAA